MVKLSQQKPGGRIASGSQCLRLIWLLRTATPRAGLSRHAPVAKAMDYMLKLGPASALAGRARNYDFSDPSGYRRHRLERLE